MAQLTLDVINPNKPRAEVDKLPIREKILRLSLTYHYISTGSFRCLFYNTIVM